MTIINDTLADPGDFAAGRPIPLFLDTSIVREWDRNSLSAEARAELEAEHAGALGYVFPWGQIIEERSAAGDQVADKPEEEGNALSWHFVLSQAHAAFLEGGGNLAELADVALECLHDGVPFEETGSPPAFITFEEGNAISVFEISVRDVASEAAARKWVHNTFLRLALPMVIDDMIGLNDSLMLDAGAGL